MPVLRRKGEELMAGHKLELMGERQPVRSETAGALIRALARVTGTIAEMARVVKLTRPAVYAVRERASWP